MNIPPLLPAAYTFNPSLKTIQFLSNAPAGLARIKLIFNNTRGVYYYNPLGGVIGGSYDIPTSTFTFTADTTGHLNTDTLFIVVDDGNQSSTETTLSGLIGSEGTNIPTAPSNETKIYRWFRWLGSQIPTSPFAVTGPLTLSQLASAGLATAAKQPAFGAAGSPALDVLSMQGISGGTPLPTRGSAIDQYGKNTRLYDIENNVRVSILSTSSAAVALPALGSSREVCLHPSTRCFIRFGTDQISAAAAAQASFPLVADVPFHTIMPATATHFRVIRDTADGFITITAVI